MDPQPGAPVRSNWVHSKTQARAGNGMCVARHPLAAEAGRAVLQRGGNAVDAAVAASFANSVVQPFANTIGGGGLLVAYRGPGETLSIDYRYEAPGRAHAEMFGLPGRAEQGVVGWSGVAGRRNEIGHLAVGVPGSVAGLSLAVERFGRLSLAEVLEPAIVLAREGFAMDWYGSLMLGAYLDLLARHPITSRTFLREGRFPYRPELTEPADTHRQPELAKTLERIGRNRVAEFYEGMTAQALLEEMRAGGGIIEATDLQRYRPRASAARECSYRSHKVLGAANASIAPLLLGVLDRVELGGLEPDDPRRLHLLIEALRRCRRDEASYYGDLPFMEVPWEVLASPQRAEALAATIDRDRRTDAWDGDALRSPAPAQEGTVHISVADRDGMLVSLTETMLGSYGSGVTTEAGVLLNNAMFAFAPLPGSPNSVAPGKRPLSNMTPLVLLRPSGEPLLALGASGGQRISSAVVQIISLVVDLGLPIEEAVAAPRIDVTGDAVLVDSRFPASMARSLTRMGHQVRILREDLSTLHFANPCGISRTADGKLWAGVNPLQPTAAAGY